MTPPDPPREVRAYLRRATCLIPPRAARVVRAELLGHLHLDMLNARLRGLDEAQAWAQALRDAGPAPLTALRFARTYTLGLALRWLLAAGLLGGAAYALGTHTPPAPAPAVQVSR